jgi:D-arabinose 1-dehydrogenase-like Zn-dependent alcohol dehydrogenase
MKALVLKQIGTTPQVSDFPKPIEQENLARVQIKYAALNHRDIWIMQGKYAGISLPVIPGSDGVGIFEDKKCILNPGMNWGRDHRFQSKNFEILGMPQNGTFAEFVSVPVENVFAMPSHLKLKEAAALPLAGITAYRALLVKCQAKKQDKVLIHGVGGGVASMAMLFAVSLGCKVYVSSSKKEKINEAIKLGAEGGVNYRSDNWLSELKELSGGIDVIIDSAGGSGFAQLLRICNPGAKIAIFGGSQGHINNVSPQILFWKQINIFGTTMGSPKDFQDMLDFVSLYEIRPIVDSVFTLEQAESAYTRMLEGSQFGKIVFELK